MRDTLAVQMQIKQELALHPEGMTERQLEAALEPYGPRQPRISSALAALLWHSEIHRKKAWMPDFSGRNGMIWTYMLKPHQEVSS